MIAKLLKKFEKNKQADKVFIREFRVPAQIGILPWEKTSTQIIVLDLAFTVGVKQIALTDRVEDAVDYAAVCDAVIAYLAAHRFNLIETLAEKLAQFLLQQFHLDWIRLSVIKPKAIADTNGVGVVIERYRAC